MEGFRRLTATQRQRLSIHAGVREQLRAALVLRHRGAARLMIAEQAQAALRPGGPDYRRFRARFLRAQADGMDLEREATTRIAFLLRQLKRMEARLDERE